MSTFDFKPKFGDPRHIKISEMIGEYDLLAEKVARTGFRATIEKMDKLQGEIDKAIAQL